MNFEAEEQRSSGDRAEIGAEIEPEIELIEPEVELRSSPSRDRGRRRSRPSPSGDWRWRSGDRAEIGGGGVEIEQRLKIRTCENSGKIQACLHSLKSIHINLQTECTSQGIHLLGLLPSANLLKFKHEIYNHFSEELRSLTRITPKSQLAEV
ncbi:uncharacterized protein A4U43_C05F16750 [Asparagus officinalis]|uniref:Uncharacterized protein n=1 Tax=Asparagus officinalis TaxID=4686 RepID=A0A5P1ES29_ASPOF|nr:uncharacterized protein A4U43_C05F16750 [Asparagus officinalis]